MTDPNHLQTGLRLKTSLKAGFRQGSMTDPNHNETALYRSPATSSTVPYASRRSPSSRAPFARTSRKRSDSSPFNYTFPLSLHAYWDMFAAALLSFLPSARIWTSAPNGTPPYFQATPKPFV